MHGRSAGGGDAIGRPVQEERTVSTHKKSLLVSIAVLGVVCGDVRSQGPVLSSWNNYPPSYVMQWGYLAYDTRSREGRLQKVVCGWNTTAHLRDDGRLFVQGTSGFWGPGFVRVTEVPPLPPGLTFTDVSIRSYGAMAIRSDGVAVGWGVLGASASPPMAPSLPAGLAYVRVALSDEHVLLLRCDGAIVTFGANTFGECNVPPLPPSVAVKDIQAGYGRSAILLADGSVRLFGANQYAQSTAPQLPTGVVYTAMAAKRSYDTLLLRSDGLIEAFGRNAEGQSNVPPLPAGRTYEHIALGDGWAVAARSDGALVVWGANSSGFGIDAPPAIPAGLRCVALDAGQIHATALLSDGRVASWGHNIVMDHFVPYRNAAGQKPTRRQAHVSSGIEHSLITYDDGTIDAFGSDIGGQLAVPPLPPGVRYVRGGAGGITSLGLRSDGQIEAWGYNGFGALNVPPLPPGMTYTDMSVEHGHSVVLRSDGNAFAFGDNSAGQCNIPPLPPGLSYVKASVNANRTVLLRSDGTLAYCGWNYSGSSGLPNPPPGTRFVDIAASGFFAAALASDNSLTLWGGTGGAYWVSPAPLPYGVYYVEIYGGYRQIILRRSDGRIDVLGTDSDLGSHVPQADPGTSCLQVSGVWRSFAARMGPTCTYVAYAPGCAGSLPPAKLIPRDTPRIGRTHEVRVWNVPGNAVAMGMGFQRTTVPTPLGPVGMPGCGLGIQVDAVMMVPGQQNEAIFQLPIPDLPQLVGVRFYQQALVLDPGANAAGAVLSEAAEGVIGYP